MGRSLNPDPQEQNELASRSMKRGIALLEENTPASLAEALPYFDKAIALRRDLPLDEVPWFRYGLAAGWMNRADVLTRLGTAENLTGAVQSYDEALAQMRHLSPEADPRFRRRQAIAWANRGLTLQTGNRLDEALQSFDRAIALLENSGDLSLLAGVWLNRGNTLLRLKKIQPLAAKTAAHHALGAVAPLENSALLAAETGLKARLLLCQAIAHLLPKNASLLTEATDAVEDGIRLTRLWENRGEPAFLRLGDDFFRFGCQVYGAHQPQFLGEFLRENLEKTPAWRDLAWSIIQRQIQQIQRGSFAFLNTPQFHPVLRRFCALRLAESFLQNTPFAATFAS